MLDLCENPETSTTYFFEETEEGEGTGMVYRRELVYVPWRPGYSLTGGSWAGLIVSESCDELLVML